MTIYSFFKKIQKPLKYGIKSSKGILAAYSLTTKRKLSNKDKFISQSIGMIFLPFLFLVVEPLTKNLSKNLQVKILLTFYAGIALGSSFSTFLSSTLFKKLPSDFSNITGMATAFIVAPLVTLVLPLCFSKIKSIFYKNNLSEDAKQEDEENSDLINSRYRLGIESGLVIGSALGASCEFLFPGFGLLASCVSGVIGICIGSLLALAAPKLLLKFNKNSQPNSSQDQTYYSYLKKTFKLGAILGTSIGVVIGTFLLPGLGSVLGGIIGAGIGGASIGAVATLARILFPDTRLTFGSFFLRKANLSVLTLKTKIGITLCSLIGALIGTFLLPGIGTAAGAALGTLVGCLGGSIIGACASYLNYRQALKLNHLGYSSEIVTNNNNEPSYYKKAKVGFSIGSSAGALLGAIIGSCVPVVGTLLGSLVGAGIGGLIGAVMPALIESAKTKIKQIYTHPQITDAHHYSMAPIQTVTPKPSFHLIKCLTEKNDNKTKGYATRQQKLMTSKEFQERKKESDSQNTQLSFFMIVKTPDSQIIYPKEQMRCNESNFSATQYQITHCSFYAEEQLPVPQPLIRCQ